MAKQDTGEKKQKRRTKSAKNEYGVTMQQELVARKYTDPESETFLNATESYVQVSGNENRHSAHGIASRMMSSPAVKNRVAMLLEEQGFGLNLRAEKLRNIGLGAAKRIEKKVLQDGEIVSYEVTPSFGEMLRAIEIANKIDGTQDMGRNYADHQKKELEDLENVVLGEWREVHE